MFALARRRRPLDIWPGFVDALAALLLVVIFVLLVFTLGHFSLSEELSGREKALERLSTQVAELAELLALEKREAADLRQTVGELTASLARANQEREVRAAELAAARAEIETAASQLAAATAAADRLRADVSSLTELKAQLEREVAQLTASLQESQQATATQTELTVKAQAQVELLNRQIAAVRKQLTEVSAALELSRGQVEDQKAKIADLGHRLNVALADKVKELARYRSEFFGRLRDALGNHPDVQIVGDRFVLQSELLFDTASAELGTGGRQQVERLARTLKEIAAVIPPDVDWVLRIDGHTDRRPIHTERFPSNWELSAARALAIVNYMISLGVPPNRLAATGFAEFHPLDPGSHEGAYARNRRIELKLTSR